MATKSYHHGDLRNALVEAGLVLLERDGPEAVSLRAVARAAGVSQSAPYAHFGSKRALMAAIATAGFSSLGSVLEVVIRREGANAVALGTAYVEFARNNAGLYRLMFGSRVELQADDVDLMTASKETFRIFAQVMADNPAHPFRDAGAIGAWSMLHGLAMLLVDGKLHLVSQTLLPEILERLARSKAT